MIYQRQHKESGRVWGVARVLGEPGKFHVRLIEGDTPSGRLHEGLHYYASRDIAFAAADALVRHRLGHHVCCEACTGWDEPL